MIIIDAHKEVFEALKEFSQVKNKTLTYLIGNHDEIELQECQRYLMNYFNNKINIIELCSKGIFQFLPFRLLMDTKRKEQINLVMNQFKPTRKDDNVASVGELLRRKVVNRFKSEKAHVNSVRPIKKFIIDGLIYDSFDTLRFLAATIYYC